jgi:hypothetical protein
LIIEPVQATFTWPNPLSVSTVKTVLNPPSHEIPFRGFTHHPPICELIAFYEMESQRLGLLLLASTSFIQLPEHDLMAVVKEKVPPTAVYFGKLHLLPML